MRTRLVWFSTWIFQGRRTGVDSKEKPPLLPGGSTRAGFTGQEPGIWTTLDPLQREVTEMVAHGYTTSQIAQKKPWSESWVEKRVEVIADKLDTPGKPRERVTQIWHGSAEIRDQ